MLDDIRRLMIGGSSGSSGGGAVEPCPRPPLKLPHCYSCPTPNAYDQTMLWTPPRDDPRFLRGSFWSVVVPGLPWVPGSSSEWPERLMTGLDFRYDRALWPKMVYEHRCRQLTHWLRWWGDARVAGGNSEEQFVDDCLRLKDLGVKYVKVWLWTKGYDPHDMTSDQLKKYFESIVTKLLKAKACDEFTPGGEWDSGNVPGEPTISFFKWVGQMAHSGGAKCYAHFFPHVTSWFADGDPRGRYGFWDDLGGDVDGLDYQAVPVLFDQPVDHGSRWDIGDFQSRLVDTLKQFEEQGNRHIMRAAEFSAFAWFPANEHPDETECDSIGHLACCTRSPRGTAYIWGSGDGNARV